MPFPAASSACRAVGMLLVAALCLCPAVSENPLDDFLNPGAPGEITEYSPSMVCRQRWNRTQQAFGMQLPKSNEFAKGNRTEARTGILIVHVGKTAGGSVNDVLKNSHIPALSLHVKPLSEAMIRDHRWIIITLRNPVHRQVSAYNFRSPSIIYNSPYWSQCGLGSLKRFYDCCPTLHAYADMLTSVGECGSVARFGECHTELDTCAYVGGVEEALERDRHKVFVVDTDSIEADLRAFMRETGVRLDLDQLPHTHEYKHASNTTDVSAADLMKLTGYVEVSGEGPLYRRLIHAFKRH